MIGDFDKRIELQAPTYAKDSQGASVPTFATVATVWAKKTTHRSDEAVQAMAQAGVAVHNFRIHYRTDVQSSWRIKEGNAVMEIIGPPMEKREGLGGRFLDITAKEGKK